MGGSKPNDRGNAAPRPHEDSPADREYLDQLINEMQAANFLGHSVRTLQAWRVRGGGPAFVKISSRSIRYTRRELMRWARSHLRTSTSDRGERGGSEDESIGSPRGM